MGYDIWLTREGVADPHCGIVSARCDRLLFGSWRRLVKTADDGDDNDALGSCASRK